MSPGTNLVIIVGQHAGWPVLRLRGELDVSGRDRLRHAISAALERHPPVLMLDVSRLEFTDCGGLSVLVWAHQCLAEHGHQLIITGATPMVRRLLYLTGLDGYLNLSSPDLVPGGHDPAPLASIRSSAARGSAHADLEPR